MSLAGLPDFHVDPDPATAETLPPVAFTDPAFLARELETVFAHHWLLVPERPGVEHRENPRGMAECVATRGARAPFALHDRPLFLQRDWEGTLRAFPNVCTHAWHTLVPGAGRDRYVTCPQHGRQFDCAGRAVAHPGFKGGTFPREVDHLRAFPVAEWAPFLFACLGAPATPFAELIAPVDAARPAWPAGALRRVPTGDEAREVAGNWKLHAWNYMDRFHVAFVHRAPGGLADAMDGASYRTELHGGAALQWAYAKDPAAGFDPALVPARFRDPAGRRVFALWWFVFPDLTLNFYPWGLSVNVYQPVPERPDRTHFLWYQFVADDAKYAARDAVWRSAQVDAEDLDAIAQVRRGVRSGFAPRGRFAPEEEAGPHWFHRQVAEAVAGP